VAAGAALAAVLLPTGAATVLFAAGAGVAGLAAVLVAAGVLAGAAGSFLPQALSTSRPARLALYRAVMRMERVM
jgi:hypothetical protein